jgi:GAF domain-containing protein/HAMP domain-containing protein
MLGFTVVALFTVMIAGTGYIATAAIGERFERVSGDVLLELVALGEIRTLTVEFLSETREYILFGEEYTLVELREVVEELDKAMESYAAAGEEFEEEEEKEFERGMANRLRAAWADIDTASAELIALYERGAGKEELKAAGEELEEAESALEVVLDEAKEAQDEELKELTAAVKVETARAQVLLVAFPIGVVALTIGTAYLLNRSIVHPVRQLEETVRRIAAGDLERVATVEREDEIGAVAQAFNQMTARLRDLIGSLEQRVTERTRDLEQRSAYLEASAQVGHAAASILETGQLMRQVVDLIRERFDLYYVGLFLVEGEWAVLRAGTGEAGRAMLARGHRLRVGEGMIGWSIANAQARVALEAGEDAVRRVAAELPETHSEAALPLRSRGRVIGALTVQHVQPGAFDQDTIVVLQTMADQVAVALDNARLFAASQEALQAERRAYGELSREAWTDLLHAQPNLGFFRDKHGVSPTGDLWRPQMEATLRTGEPTLGEGDATTLATSIKVRGQVIGVIDAHKPDGAGEWTPAEIALLETLTDRLGEALESARLFQDTQRRAAREQLTGEVTARMRETLDVETVLKTAVQEVRQALQLPEVVVRLMEQ